MSKRQQQLTDCDGDILTDLQSEKLIDRDEDADLFEHLVEDFQDMMQDKEILRNCIEGFIDNLINQFTLGIIFDIQRKYRTNAYCLEIESGDEEDSSDIDIFKQCNVKKNQYCECPKCDGAVAASRFALHLDECMGIGSGRRVRLSRNASRRAVNNKEKNDSSLYGGIPSDNDDDVDWSSAKKKRNRKKKKEIKKKNRGSPKKSMDSDSESLNIDIEGDDDELTNLRDVLHLQDRRSNSASPADGASTSISPKKRDKSKKKSRGKDGSSPSTSMILD